MTVFYHSFTVAFRHHKLLNDRLKSPTSS